MEKILMNSLQGNENAVIKSTDFQNDAGIEVKYGILY